MVKNLLDYPDIIDLIANELFHGLDEYNPEIHNKFFVSRQVEATKLYAILSDITQYPHSNRNVIIKGDPGVGKTSFIKWFLRENSAEFGSPKSFFLDLQAKGKEKDFRVLRESVLRDIIKNLKEFLEIEARVQCNEVIFPPLDEYSLNFSFETICEKLNKASKKRWFLFVDDIDYIDENFLNPLVNLLIPLLTSSNCIIVLAARIPAFNAIMNADLTRSLYFDPDGDNITLTHLDPEEIARQRLSIICSDTAMSIRQQIQKEQQSLRGIAKLWNAISGWLSPTLPNEEVIETIRIPFSERQYRGMMVLINLINKDSLHNPANIFY